MNVIPEITNPLGKYWEQPKREDILVDDTHAIMTEATLKQLKNYSTSTPSGVYEGKMWRSEYIQKNKTFHYLHWWGVSEDPNKCSGNTRIIILID